MLAALSQVRVPISLRRTKRLVVLLQLLLDSFAASRSYRYLVEEQRLLALCCLG